MSRKEKLDLGESVSLQPQDALRSTIDAPRFDEENPIWPEIELDILSTVNAAQAGRANLLANLELGDALIEMSHSTQEVDAPWVDAANLVPPIVQPEIESLRDQVIQTVFVPRLYRVKGLNEQAAAESSRMEHWINSMMHQERDEDFSIEGSWYETAAAIIQGSLSDGTCGIEAWWRKSTRKKRLVSRSPKLDKDGNQAIDDDGMPITESKVDWVEEIVAEPAVSMVILKDVMLSPADSRSHRTAAAVVRTKWMYEEDFKRLMKGAQKDDVGYFSRENIEQALVYVEAGISETSYDPDGNFDKDAGGQIDSGLGQGSMTSRRWKNRGPLEIRFVLSKQYDMNDDDRAERNVFWFHEQSQKLLGWMPYEYVINRWPLEFLALFPRKAQWYGFSIPERLADCVDEYAVNTNQRINLIDLCVNPEKLVKLGSDIRNKDAIRGPGCELTVEDMADVKYLDPPQVPSASFQQDQQILNLISKATRQAAPMSGTPGPTRQTATQARQLAAATGVGVNAMAVTTRFFLRRFMNLILDLYRQFATEDITYKSGDRYLKVPYDILHLPYQIDVAGIEDPTDAVTAAERAAVYAEQISKLCPTIGPASSSKKEWALGRMISEVNQIVDVASIIGTEEDAQRTDEQRQQMMQQQAAMGVQPGEKPGAGGKSAG